MAKKKSKKGKYKKAKKIVLGVLMAYVLIRFWHMQEELFIFPNTFSQVLRLTGWTVQEKQ